MVDFGAEWCGPCQAMEPVIRELAKEYEGRIVVGSCDVEENNALAVRFSIRNVPTVLLLKNGEVVDRCVGSVPQTTLVESWKNYCNNTATEKTTGSFLISNDPVVF